MSKYLNQKNSYTCLTFLLFIKLSFVEVESHLQIYEFNYVDANYLYFVAKILKFNLIEEWHLLTFIK